MAAASPVEDILFDCLAWIKAGIAAYLRAIETERADSIALKDPAVYEVSDADPWGQTSYPAVLLYPSDAPIEADIDSGHDEINLTAELLIVFSDGTPASGAKRALRYAEAVREMVRDDRSMDGGVDFITVTRITYYATDPEQLAIRLVGVTLNIRKTVSQ